jgi:hypothetical protein
MAFARERFDVFAQEYIGTRINQSTFKKIPLLYLLVGLGGNHTATTNTIGRPGVGDVFAGKKYSKAQREAMAGVNSYQPVILANSTDDTKKMGARDTMPTVSNATTSSHDQLLGTAKFNWCRKATPILVWKESLFRAERNAASGTKGKAVANVVATASDFALNKHLDAWAAAFWTGTPASQSSDPWSDVSGLTDALGSTTNTYGNVDRSVAANAQWVPQLVSSARAAKLSSIIDEANLTLNCGIVGNGIDVVLTTPALYRTFKDEVRAKGATIMADGLPQMGEYGFKKECLKFDNTYVMYDPLCPAGYVACLNLETWTVIMGASEKGRNGFQVGKFVDLSEYAEGAKDALQSMVDTRMIVACENPRVNALFTSVS